MLMTARLLPVAYLALAGCLQSPGAAPLLGSGPADSADDVAEPSDGSAVPDVPPDQSGDSSSDLPADMSTDGASSDASADLPDAPADLPDLSPPVFVPPWIEVTASDAFTCALDSAGGAYCWGDNSYGRLGLGLGFQNQQFDTPRRVATSQRFTRITAGDRHVCAIAMDQTVWCWGGNGDGLNQDMQVDDDIPMSPVYLPTKTDAPEAVDIAAGARHTCVLTAAVAGRLFGEVWCWGRNLQSQSGASPSEFVDVHHVGFTQGADAIASGLSHSCFIGSADQPKCWGAGGVTVMADASNAPYPDPEFVGDGTTELSELVVGREHACGITAGGGVRCWGSNLKVNDTVIVGKLGYAGSSGSGFPMMDVAFPAGGSFRSVTAGWNHSCAIETVTAAAWCWGDNSSDQLGATQMAVGEPVSVGGAWSQVSAGHTHTCAIDASADGELFCWGANDQGQLGIGNRSPAGTPAPVVLP